jgi:catechol 2,3-dioxygenase-like lactoylglutathione lyase family enzyme
MTELNLRAVEAKAYVPSKNFEQSKRFYQEIGFELDWSTDELACLRHGSCAFLLQDFDLPGHADNFQMHLLVEDVDHWWHHVQSKGIDAKPPQDRPWGLRDFALLDPSGVLWRIGQPLYRRGA